MDFQKYLVWSFINIVHGPLLFDFRTEVGLVCLKGLIIIRYERLLRFLKLSNFEHLGTACYLKSILVSFNFLKLSLNLLMSCTSMRIFNLWNECIAIKTDLKHFYANKRLISLYNINFNIKSKLASFIII